MSHDQAERLVVALESIEGLLRRLLDEKVYARAQAEQRPRNAGLRPGEYA